MPIRARKVRTGRRLAGPAGLAVLAASMLVATLAVVAFGRGMVSKGAVRDASAARGTIASSTPATSTPVKAAEAALASATATPAPAPPSRPATTPPVSHPATPAPAPKPASKPPVTAAAVPSVDAYKGLGSWVDIWEDGAWANPAATVRNMKSHGVKTLYLETANSKSPYALKDPSAIATFIRTAHANGMKVVAWYLPDMQNVNFDFGRVSQAIRFRTSDGQTFDSFALDIESPVVASQTARNTQLMALSTRIRNLVGPKYPLGAITPSPVGLSKAGSYWGSFPWASVARTYDVIVPMSYYTYHGDGNVAAYNDTIANMRILRSKPGCAKIPVHLIGGLAEGSSPSEVKAFVQATEKSGAVGGSLYSWSGTNPSHWDQLESLAD